MIDASRDEKARQEEFPWSRSQFHTDYNAVLAHYKVASCLENCRGTSVLDLACGDGLMTEAFAAHFRRTVGVDASGRHLALARDRVPKAEFVESLIEELDLAETFDSVFLLDVLEHVIDPALLLRKAASFLNDEGVMIVHVPNSNAVNRHIAVLMGTLTSLDELTPFDLTIAGHRRSYTLQTLEREIRSAGLTVRKLGGIFYKMLSTAQIDWFLKNGLWTDGCFGWGRIGVEPRDWKAEFCRACYEYGKTRPEDCNIIYAVLAK